MYLFNPKFPTLALNPNHNPQQTCMDQLCGGRLAALNYMNMLLAGTGGKFSWENYGRRWETDHYPRKMKNVDFMSEKSIRQTHHFRNLRPRVPYTNKGDRH
jgi:hypothetical protein